MKALSLKQPWLSWVIQGRKTLETRTWTTKHRGQILLCASRSVDWEAWALHSTDTDDMKPVGQALAVGQLVDCRKMTPADEPLALCPWDDRRYVWVLEDVFKIDPFPVKGMLGLFTVDVPTLSVSFTTP